MQTTQHRLYDGSLEIRKDLADRALNANKSLKVLVSAECNDYMILNRELLLHPTEGIGQTRTNGKFTETYALCKYTWLPFQEIGRTLRIIEKNKNGNKRGKQNRSKL